jgi:hypothetical protein
LFSIGRQRGGERILVFHFTMVGDGIAILVLMTTFVRRYTDTQYLWRGWGGGILLSVVREHCTDIF